MEKINCLVLSAGETLHYPKDDDYASVKELNKEKLEIDFTNDFKRENSGVWHKTLDKHTYNEIVSPLLTNVAGTAALLSSFLKGVKKVRSQETKGAKGKKKRFICIVVTSFEGRFVEKTPFHPITNACKSAIEQLVFTLQAQARFLNCEITLSDPGWVYTESAFGKVKGPVPIDFGVSQILQPLLIENKEYKIHRRETKLIPSNIPQCTKKEGTIKLILKPCQCVINFPHYDSDGGKTERFLYYCPVCHTRIESRDFYIENHEARDAFLKVAEKYCLHKDITRNILLKSGMALM